LTRVNDEAAFNDKDKSNGDDEGLSALDNNEIVATFLKLAALLTSNKSAWNGKATFNDDNGDDEGLSALDKYNGLSALDNNNEIVATFLKLAASLTSNKSVWNGEATFNDNNGDDEGLSALDNNNEIVATFLS
jgi:hypothetical protein